MVEYFSPHLLRKVNEPPKRLFVHPRSLPISFAPMALLFSQGCAVLGIIYFVLSHAFLMMRTYQNPYFIEELKAKYAYGCRQERQYYA